MKIKIILACVILISVILSCTRNDRIRDDVTKLHGKEISFPIGYISSRSALVEKVLNSRCKVVTFIENPPCTQCIIKTIQIYQREMFKIDKDIPYVIVISTKEKEEFLHVLDSLPMRYPIMFYENDVFSKENQLDNVLVYNRTFLLDDANKVVVVGEPFGKKKMEDLYRKAIHKKKN